MELRAPSIAAASASAASNGSIGNYPDTKSAACTAKIATNQWTAAPATANASAVATTTSSV